MSKLQSIRARAAQNLKPPPCEPEPTMAVSVGDCTITLPLADAERVKAFAVYLSETAPRPPGAP